MRPFLNIITLVKNNRGCYIIDTIKGCSYLKINSNGCYNDCYAKNIISRYKEFDFTKTIERKFIYNKNQKYMFNFYDDKHENQIIQKIKKINMPFVRIGEMGDPSENWLHTINICKIISYAKKPIIIITKHWETIPNNLLKEIKKLNIYINTSISALDNDYEIEHRLNQFNRIKHYCNSVLRIVSCDFNKNNYEGRIRSKIQERLFKNNKIIDTAFRPNINNPLVINKVINIEEKQFLKSKAIVSLFNKNTYLGRCESCPEMCGINLFKNVDKVN